jgi:hypothetical protein
MNRIADEWLQTPNTQVECYERLWITPVGMKACCSRVPDVLKRILEKISQLNDFEFYCKTTERTCNGVLYRYYVQNGVSNKFSYKQHWIFTYLFDCCKVDVNRPTGAWGHSDESDSDDGSEMSLSSLTATLCQEDQDCEEGLGGSASV